MQLDVVNQKNEKVGALTLSDEVFGGRVTPPIPWERHLLSSRAVSREPMQPAAA